MRSEPFLFMQKVPAKKLASFFSSSLQNEDPTVSRRNVCLAAESVR